MAKRVIFTTAFYLLLTGLAGCGGEDVGQVQDLGAITVRAPKQWTVQTPTSPMRKAQYLLPKAKTDVEDATLVVFYFGQGEGGSVELNLERWYGQFQQPDGSSSKEKAMVSRRTASGMPVTMADVSGTYAPSGMGPMMPAPEPKPGYRMLAAIVESPQGPYFFKLTGPERTVEEWHRSFERFIDRIEKK